MRFAKLTIVMLCCATLVCVAQTTSVTLQVTDTDGQSWNNGSYTAQLVMPPGQPQPQAFVIAGTTTVVPNQFQSAGLNSTGGGSLIVTPNASIAPGGSQWAFTFNPLATPAASYQTLVTISGTTQTVSPVPPGIRVSVNTPVNRVLAYLDLEITGANLGSVYFNLTDTTVHLCSVFISNTCTWTVGSGTGITIGGDLFAINGTQQEVIGLENNALPALVAGFLQWNGSNWVFSTPGGVISGLTTGFLTKALNSTTIGNSGFDDGVTTANTGTYGSSGGFAVPNGPIKVGTAPTACGSAPNCIAFGQTATAGSPTAGQNYFKSVAGGWVCSINGGGETSCISGGITGATANGGLVLTGTTLGLLLTCTDKQGLSWNNGTTSWGCATIDLSTTAVTGNLGVSHLNSGTGASGTTAWFGDGTWKSVLSQGGGGLPAPQIGDSIRFNVLGDSQWDATQSGFHNAATMYEVVGTSGPSQYGNVGNSNASSISNSAPGNFPIATDSASRSYTSAASASTSTIIGETFGGAASFGIYGFGSFYRWSSRFRPGNTTNVRYWNGVFRYDTGGTGTETATCLSNTSLATNTPNKRFIAFRYSAGTDTNWQAVTSTGSGGAQTVTDTGIAPDTTAAHTFEITYDGTTARFFIDGVIKVTTTTNVPAGSIASAMGCWSGDNENTATVIVGTHYWTSIELK